MQQLLSGWREGENVISSDDDVLGGIIFLRSRFLGLLFG
jgi:hypothetical protein